VIPRRLNADEVRAVGQFDVVLCLSVLHHLEDWRGMLEALHAVADKALFVETPNSRESLPGTHNLRAVNEALIYMGGPVLTVTPGHDPEHLRALRLVSCDRQVAFGQVFDGSGTASQVFPDFDEMTWTLGYTPYPGSLNVRLGREYPFPPTNCVVSEPPRHYEFWPASVNGHECHAMRPAKAHANSVEFVASERLRNHQIETGDTVTLMLPRPASDTMGVCTTVWESYARYLPEWAESLAAQTVRPDHVVIVDAGWPKGRRGWREKTKRTLREADIRFDWVKSKKRKQTWEPGDRPVGSPTMGELRNLAIGSLDTTWVAHLDADDTYLPDTLEAARNLTPDADVIAFGALVDGQAVLTPPGNPVTGGGGTPYSCSAFRKSLWVQRPFDPTTDYIDSSLWAGFAGLGARFVSYGPAFVYRQHPGSHRRNISPSQQEEARQLLATARDRSQREQGIVAPPMDPPKIPGVGCECSGDGFSHRCKQNLVRDPLSGRWEPGWVHPKEPR